MWTRPASVRWWAPTSLIKRIDGHWHLLELVIECTAHFKSLGWSIFSDSSIPWRKPQTPPRICIAGRKHGQIVSYQLRHDGTFVPERLLATANAPLPITCSPRISSEHPTTAAGLRLTPFF